MNQRDAGLRGVPRPAIFNMDKFLLQNTWKALKGSSADNLQLIVDTAKSLALPLTVRPELEFGQVYNKILNADRGRIMFMIELLASMLRLVGMDKVERILNAEAPLLEAYAKEQGLDKFILSGDFTLDDLKALFWFRDVNDYAMSMHIAIMRGDELGQKCLLHSFVERTPDLFDSPERKAKAFDMLQMYGLNPMLFTMLMKTYALGKVGEDQVAVSEAETLLREVMGDEFENINVILIRS